MIRRGLQILLIVSLLCGTATQTLACVFLMQLGNHTCCRSSIAMNVPAKMHPALSHQEPEKTLPCCKTSPTNLQPTLLTRSECRKDFSSSTAIVAGTTILPLTKERVSSLRKYTASDLSPPPSFILYHSLLI